MILMIWSVRKSSCKSSASQGAEYEEKESRACVLMNFNRACEAARTGHHGVLVARASNVEVYLGIGDANYQVFRTWIDVKKH